MFNTFRRCEHMLDTGEESLPSAYWLQTWQETPDFQKYKQKLPANCVFVNALKKSRGSITGMAHNNYACQGDIEDVI